MESSIIFMVVGLITTTLCGGGSCLFVLLLIVGVLALRKRGKKKITAREAMNAGVESVSQVFVRGQGGLEPADDDDDDDE